MKLLLLWLTLLCPAVAFSPVNNAMLTTQTQSYTASTSQTILSALPPAFEEDASMVSTITSSRTAGLSSKVVAGLCTGLVTFASCAFAGDEIEMAELPPPYVPALFAVLLLLGVGVLTGSLGNVIDEGM